MDPTRESADAARGEAPHEAWRRLFRCASVPAALDEIASWTGAAAWIEMTVEFPDALGREAATYRGERVGDSEDPFRTVASVGGRPPWRLIVGWRPLLPLEASFAEQAASALAAWRAHRVELERSRAREAAAARDADLLRSLSRRLSEARTLDALLRDVSEALHEAGPFDLVAFARRTGGRIHAEAFTTRPVSEGRLEALARTLAAAWGDPTPTELPVVVHPLRAHDGSRGERAGFDPGEAVVQTITRRGAPALRAALVADAEPTDRLLRLFFGAMNDLAIHVDRIMTVAEAEQGRFRAILDSMPQAVFLADPGLRILKANRAAASLWPRLGLGPGAALHRIGTVDVATLVPRLSAGKVDAVNAEAALVDGTTLAITLSDVRGEPGRSEGLVLVLTDVSESRRFQTQIAQSEKLSSLGRMIAAVAHELNNPLSTVIGYAQLAASTPPGDKLAKRLETVAQEAQRCRKIVQNLLRFSRPHAPERRAVSLNDVVETVLSLVSYPLRKDGIRIETDLDPSIPPVVGDAHQLEQAVLNLLNNAHQALREAGIGGTIRVQTASPAPDRVVLGVRDDGPGIPASLRARVFDPFFTTKQPGEGTGLGLWLVYGTVQAHGGRIELDTGEGAGALFRITLPAGGVEAVREPAKPAAVLAGPATPSARILVAETEASLASLMCEALVADGLEAVAATDEDELLRRLADGTFDVVVSDLALPGRGLAHLCGEVSRLKPGLERRLLVTTGDSVSAEPSLLAARLGVEILHKPFALDDLRSKVRSKLAAARSH